MNKKNTPTKKTCHACGNECDTSPIIIFGRPLKTGMPVLCEECQEKEELAQSHQERERDAKREWERVVPVRYRETSLDHQDFNRLAWLEIKKWSSKAGKNLGLVGDTGRCKTRMIALHVRRMIWQGRRVEWCNATGFQWAAQRQFRDDEGADARRWLRAWRKAPVLVIDDLGKQKWTDTVEAEFYDLLEHRTSRNRLILWTANTHPEQMLTMRQLSKDRGGPIVGRLMDETEIAMV